MVLCGANEMEDPNVSRNDKYPGDDTTQDMSHIPFLAAIGNHTSCLTELNLIAKKVSGPLLSM